MDIFFTILRFGVPLAIIALGFAYQQGALDEVMTALNNADGYEYVDDDYDDRELYEEDEGESGYEDADYYSDY